MSQDQRPDYRIAFSEDLASRDGGVSKDARNHNAFLEPWAGGVRTWQRPALGSGVSGLGTGQGMIPLGNSVLNAAEGTLYISIPVQGTKSGTNTGVAGAVGVLNNRIHRFDLTNGTANNAAPLWPFSWAQEGTGTFALSQYSLAEGQGFIWAYGGGGGAFDLYHTVNANWISGGFGDGAYLGPIAAMGTAVYGFGQGGISQNAEFHVYNGVSTTGTGRVTGTQSGVFGSFSMAANVMLGSGGGAVWAIGTGTYTGGTGVVLAIKGTQASAGRFTWSLVGTGPVLTVPAGQNTKSPRLAWWNNAMYIPTGTGSAFTILRVPTSGAWTTFAAGTVGFNLTGDRALVASGSSMFFLSGTSTQGLEVQFTPSNVPNSRSAIGAISKFLAAQSWSKNITGSQVVLQGRDYLYVYDVATGVLTQVSGSVFPAFMVPGLVYLDSTYYVMDSNGIIWNSSPGVDDPLTWPSDGFISTQFEPDQGVAITKVVNYVVGFGQWSTELFWDGNLTAVGSPLLPVQNGVLLVGCASAGSIAQTESTVIWIGQRKGASTTQQKGRFIAMLVGSSYQELSTPDVNRILDVDDLATVYACVLELGGHSWYILTLVTSGITLVFDMKQKRWYTWGRYTLGNSFTVTGLGSVNGLATGTAAGHTFADGDPVAISGVTGTGANSPFNGTYNVNVTTSGQFTYPVNISGTTTAAGTMAAQSWTEGPFDAIAVAGIGNIQLIQDSTGAILTASLGTYVDLSGTPINLKLRTNNIDNGNNERKFVPALGMIADLVATTDYALVRHTDNDFQNYTYYRRFDLSQTRNVENRFGQYRRRAWEVRYTGTNQFRLQYIEPEVEQGRS